MVSFPQSIEADHTVNAFFISKLVRLNVHEPLLMSIGFKSKLGSLSFFLLKSFSPIMVLWDRGKLFTGPTRPCWLRLICALAKLIMRCKRAKPKVDNDADTE